MLPPWPDSLGGRRKPDLASSNWLPAYGVLRVVLSDCHANDLPTRVRFIRPWCWKHFGIRVIVQCLDRIHDAVGQCGVAGETASRGEHARPAALTGDLGLPRHL